MAIVSCKECGAKISSKAASCPGCGAPVKKKAGIGTWIRAAIGLVVVGAIFSAGHNPPNDSVGSVERHREEEAPATCRKDDLECRGNKAITAASIHCRPKIEALAKHSLRWTDGAFERKFDRFRWAAGQEGGHLEMIGNKVEFQNGFGAFTPMIYSCELGDDDSEALIVQAAEGRLSE